VALRIYTRFVALSTAVLIFAGGLVTSTGSGLSVPDWPNTYGWFMFTFPLEKMVGGIRYEHAHRLIASTVGFLILAVCPSAPVAPPFAAAAKGDSAVGGTYVGNPVAIAAAHAVLDTIAEDRLADRAVEVGETIRSRMESWCERFDSVVEVRGLGVLDIRTIFGEAALRPRKNVKLIVHLERPSSDFAPLERLPLKPGSEQLMGVDIRKVTVPVAAGRNLAVLTEAAVRNYVLQIRGFDSTREFVARQSQQIKGGE